MGKYFDFADNFRKNLLDREDVALDLEDYPEIERHERSHGRHSGISPHQLPDIIDRTFGPLGRYNCYPGVPGHGCYALAVFVSMQLKEFKGNTRGHLTLRGAIEKLIQHIIGSCPGHTQDAVLLTDNWDPNVIQEWRSTVINIMKRDNVNFEIYLITRNRTVEMNL